MSKIDEVIIEYNNRNRIIIVDYYENDEIVSLKFIDGNKIAITQKIVNDLIINGIINFINLRLAEENHNDVCNH